MKNITARYFVTLLTCPDMFELANDTSTYHDFADHSTNFLADEALQMNQWNMPNIDPNPESLGSNKEYKFSVMQDRLWDCVKVTGFLLHRGFMKTVFHELLEADDFQRNTFFSTLFDKMHLDLKNIK